MRFGLKAGNGQGEYYERFDIFEKVKHYRIPGGQWVGNQLLALGMIYFRMLGLL